ncbi:SRPBCC family protein [Streptomyces sp. NPDC002055]|uniref:SRPBCC family protein n=1 Tax=Streptomyces sp. NPDC002055 TaxID=3154534 RepID=UPI00332A775D
MARRLRPVDLDFVRTAPVRLVFRTGAAAPPEAVHRALAEDVTGWPRWFRAVAAVRPTDGGRGREVRLRGGVRFAETVMAAEAPDRYAYRVDATNAPALGALLEEWRLTADGAGTRVQWTFAADGPAPLRFALRLLRPGLGHAFRTAVRTLDRRLMAGSAA